jgi:hypothetical protein
MPELFNSPKSVKTVVIEAVVVGVCLIGFYYAVNYTGIVNYLLTNFQNIPKFNLAYELFLAGALFHLVFEYTGVNKWYVDNYSLA